LSAHGSGKVNAVSRVSGLLEPEFTHPIEQGLESSGFSAKEPSDEGDDDCDSREE
jgi:hypothetical protein